MNAEGFWRRVERGDRCWLWGGAIKGNGYGALNFNGRTALAHRVAYELAHGPIPDGLEVHHECQTRACVRADHMRLVTPQEHAAIHNPPCAPRWRKPWFQCPRRSRYVRRVGTLDTHL